MGIVLPDDLPKEAVTVDAKSVWQYLYATHPFNNHLNEPFSLCQCKKRPTLYWF